MKKAILLLVLILMSFLNKAQQTLAWANALKGNGIGFSSTTDAAGNIYNIGNFSGTMDFDPGVGVNTITAVGTGDAYLTKLDANGNLIWVRTLGGASAACAFSGITLDAAGNIHLTGYYSATVDFDPGVGVFNYTSAGGYDFFVLKLNASGNFVWAKSVGGGGGGNNFDLSSSIDIDLSGNVYTTGYFYNTVDFDPGAGVFNLTAVGQKEIFILKLNSSGNFVWAKSIGGLYDDSGSSIHIDIAGNVLVGGYFADVVDFNPGAGVYNLSASTTYAGFILKLDVNGNFIWAKSITSAGGTVECRTVVSDALGDVYATGYFAGTASFDGLFTLPSLGSNDVYVTKLTSSGNFLWAKSFGGTAIEIGRCIALDSDNNIYLTGNFQGTCDFDPNAGTYTLTSVGGDDIYICKLDNSGNFLCAGGMGGVNNEMGLSICLDANNNMVNTGYIQSTTDFDPGAGIFTITPVGTTEPFITKYTPFLALAATSNSVCDGASITLTTTGANTYSWSPSTGLNTTTGATVIATTTTNITYTVFGKTGCLVTATPMAINLLAKPLFTPPANPQKIYCVPDSTLLQSTSSQTNTVLKWRKSVSTTYTNQPYYAKSSGNYYSIVTNTTNGCSDSTLISVLNYQNYPNSKITSHTYPGPVTPIDTVTCYQPTVSIVGGSDTVDVSLAWRNTITNSLSANPVNLTAQTNLKLIVTNTITGCVDSSLIVLVAQNNAPVNYSLNASIHSLNCSIYTATLNALGTQSNNITLWAGPSFTNQANPQIVNSIGYYTVTSTNTLSGCVGIKTVEVVYNNTLLLKSSNDTLVCKNSNVNITSAALGTVTGISYSWSNGSNNQINNITASNTVTYVVNANGGGCNGIDTVIVNVAPLTNDSVVAYKSCSTPTAGSIVIFANSGIAPFQYSINNGLTFSSVNSFTNVAFGTYTTMVKDGLGCTKANTVTLDAFSNLPVPKFIVSTLNSKNDTIVLVDISVPKPDSVQWLLPVNVTKIGGTMFSPVIVVNDTGSFNVTMKAFYGSCIINTTKTIKFGKVDSLAATNYNANGIKSVILYPNPNNGQFSVDVEFYKKQNASIQVLSSNGVQQFQQNFYDITLFSLPVNLTQLVNGAYVLRVIGEYDVKAISFIISK
jgi:hypothetical protein